MACDPATLVEDSKCLWAAMGRKQLLASWALLTCVGVAPPGDTTRITEEGDTRVTEEGDTRVIE